MNPLRYLTGTLWDQQKKKKTRQNKVRLPCPESWGKSTSAWLCQDLRRLWSLLGRMWYGLSPTNYKMKSAARVGVQRREDHLPPWSVNFKIRLGIYFSIPWFVDNNVFPWASMLLPSLSCPVSLDLNWRCPSVENPELTSQINSVLDQLFSSHF